MTFEEFGFEKRIWRGIKEAGFLTPMPVQTQCFNLLIKEHRDVYAQSQTGTGKTAAFLLSIFQLLSAEENYKGDKALIIVPTRELAVQIEREGVKLGKYLNFRIGSVFGGVGYGQQERMLEHGLDILIGTPGRLIDFSRKRKIKLKDFRFLVIDEADRLFDMGFLPDLRTILKGMRPITERHTLFFSATLNARVGNLAWEYMNNPGEITIEPEKVTVDTVTQELYHVGRDEKMQLLLGLLKSNNADNAVIFTNTRHSAWEVAKRMEVNGYKVKSLMGDLPQAKRLKIVDALKQGHHKFIVATDVAARGLHIEKLGMVINYDVPLDPEGYIHRIGRTARAGKKGKTITMACEEYVYGLESIEKLLGRKLPVRWADESLFFRDKSAGMRFSPRERYKDMGHNSRSDGTPEKRKKHLAVNRKPKGYRNPITGKMALDKHAAQVQSTVSAVVGGNLNDLENHHQPTLSPSQSDGRKIRKKPSGKGRNSSVEKINTKMKGISSDTTIDERLEYYRKKYGEDFRLSHSDSGKKSRSKKHKAQGKPQNTPPDRQEQKKKGLLKGLFRKPQGG